MIRIEYDGKYPNLCSGSLVVIVDEVRWQFPSYCLCSGGSVSFTDEWDEIVTEGPWSIDNWPDGFPSDMKQAVIDAVNYEIPHGCCGGCI